uniref:Uncharacterized protein n=1 Tax=Parascaris equorum TaxID=6256 RepID=A0A914RW39_PAREQ
MDERCLTFEWIPNEEQLLQHYAKVGQTLHDARQKGNAFGFDVALEVASLIQCNSMNKRSPSSV